MSIIRNIGAFEYEDIRLTPDELKTGKVNGKPLAASDYRPTGDEMDMRKVILQHFILGYQNMYKPRREFNDLSVIGRMQVDQMSFNTYQPNNGEAPEGDVIEGWRSAAIRPVVRNKVISIAAHATSRLIYPKIFAFNEQSEAQNDAAQAMRDLMEWSAEKCDYGKTSFYSVISALVNPASIVYTEYGEVYKNIKVKDKDGKWKVEKVCDDEYSGFKDEMVPVDELYIENVYEHDIQRQGWLIWRKVISFSQAQNKYSSHPNFKYVKPGVQIIYNDVNQTFYEVYDTNMRQDLVEEIKYWNKSMDCFIILVNGVMLTDFDNPNPRLDKLYPFIKFGYELIDEGKFFYYKSLVFKMQGDANIVNTLYPLIIDGTYLSIFPALINTGSEAISSDVIVPGAVTNIADPNSRVTPIIQNMQNLRAGLDTLEKVEESISESSLEPTQQGQNQPAGTTAYEISRMEANAATVLGAFVKMIMFYVKQYGWLRISDIIQHLTILDVTKIEDDAELVFKSFIIPNKGKNPSKLINFKELGEMSQDEHLYKSFDIYSKEEKTGQEIMWVDAPLFRELKFMVVVSADALNQRSGELESAIGAEAFDRSISAATAGVSVDLEKVYKDFILDKIPWMKDPNEYIKEAQPMPQIMPQLPTEPTKAPNQLSPTVPVTGRALV